KVELLIGGIPCEPFSIARRQKGDDFCEMHDKADLSMFFLMIVEAVNPRVILLEEVPYYAKSGIGLATISALKRMGYNVEVKNVKGTDYGSFETRKRVVIIASMEDIEFPEPEPVTGKMSDILLHPEDPRCEWFDENSKPWIFKHWKNQESKGNNFNEKYVNMIDEDSTYVNTITKRYMNIQGSNPLVKHPSKQGVFRLITIDEIRKIKQVNEKYYLGDFKTLQGEILGQAVLVKVFSKIIEKVTGMVTP
ncbi:MAG: DNA cytosine methyltransferase, partial [Thaumarchaeota archaeon]|nr:DNA cytosine methyltransferase [Nitrososphaerota archaeon]